MDTDQNPYDTEAWQREPGCVCEDGDSPCPVHGEDEPPAAAEMPEGWCAIGGDERAPLAFAHHGLLAVISLERIRALLATQGLTVVGAKELAVLEAWSRLNDEEVMRIYRSGNVEQDLAAAELARREP